jgi:putative Mn2+ efflux pump MntP
MGMPKKLSTNHPAIQNAAFPQEQEENLVHGSRRGAASMIGATIGWVVGSMLSIFTQQLHWLLVAPAIGIFIGCVFGRSFFGYHPRLINVP